MTPRNRNFEAWVKVAVGTALAGGPPHRSQRAGLPLWAPASGASVEARFTVGVQDLGRWEPSPRKAGHAFPVQAMALAAALRAQIARAGKSPKVVLEATYGWYWAADTLAAAGAEVHLAHPLGVKAFSYRRVKDDV